MTYMTAPREASMNAYRSSKALAERAAWDFQEAHQPSWDLATVNPPLICELKNPM